MDLLEQSVIGLATPVVGGTGLMDTVALRSALMFTPPVTVVETGYLLIGATSDRLITSTGDIFTHSSS